MVEIWGRLTEQQSRNQTKTLRVLRAFAVKVQPRNHREAAKSAKSAKISRRKILSCRQRIFAYCGSVFICGFSCAASINKVKLERMKIGEPVVLDGRFVRLEPLTMGHVPALAEVGLDPELWRWTTGHLATA